MEATVTGIQRRKSASQAGYFEIDNETSARSNALQVDNLHFIFLSVKQRALEAEAAKGDSDAAAEIRKELAILREKVEYYNQALKGKEEEIRVLKESTKEFNNNDSVKVS